MLCCWHEAGERAHELSDSRLWKLGEDMNSPLEPPERIQACQHLDFDPISYCLARLLSTDLPCYLNKEEKLYM